MSHNGLSSFVKALLHCEMFRATCLAMFWRHCGGTSCMRHFSVTYPATAKIVAKQVARAVAESRIKFYFFVQLVSQRFWPLQGMLHCEMFRATCAATMTPKYCE